MPVSISKIFDIQGRVIAPAIQSLSLDICSFSKSENLPSSCAISFNNYKEVANFFGDITLPECQYASIYFKGYKNSIKVPSKLLMSRWVDTDISALMISIPIASLEAIKAAGNSYCTITFSKLDETLTTEQIFISAAAMSAVTSYSNMASVLQTSINTAATEEAVTVTYNPGNKNIVLKTKLLGANAYISAASFPEGTVGSNLGALLGIETPAFLSQGSIARTSAENVAHVINCVSDFVGFVAFYEMPETVSTEVAAYLDSISDDFVFFAQTSNKLALLAGDTTALKPMVAGYKNVFAQYGSVANTVFSSAIGACIDYVNGTVSNWSFNTQDGLVADVNTDTEYDALVINGYNFFSSYGLKASESTFLYNGNVTGIYNWVDALYNSIWLKDSLQIDLVQIFTSVNNIPYNESGYSLIRSAVQNSIDLALNNGVISTGVVLGNDQKLILTQELGIDVSSTLEASGYLLIVSDPGSKARIERQTPICKLIYTYAGNINKITLDSVQVQ